MLIPDVELKIEKYEQEGKIRYRWFHLKGGTHKEYLKRKVYGKIEKYELENYPIEDKTKNNRNILPKESEVNYKKKISEIDKWTPQRKRKYQKNVSGDKIPHFVYILVIFIYVENVLFNTLYKIGMSKDLLARKAHLLKDWKKKLKSKKIKIHADFKTREKFDSHESAKRREDSLKNMTEKYSLDESDKINMNKSFTDKIDGYTEIRKELPNLKEYIAENRITY